MSIDLIAATVSVISLVAALFWAYCDDCRVVRRHRSRIQTPPDAKPSQVTKVA
jgi:hypothetical protein